MLTRCPHCETIFRVTPEQLKVRLGKVRCGECNQVFNAVETLVEEVAPTPAVSIPKQADTPDKIEDSLLAPEHFILPSTTEIPSESPMGDAIVEDTGPVCTAESSVPDTTEESQAPPEPVSPTAPEIDPLEPATVEPVAEAIPEPVPLEPFLHEAPAETRKVWPWILGGSFALLALGLQVAVQFRVELAVLASAARPLLEAVCSAAGCEVGLPAKAELMLIESSDLIPDAERKGVMSLAATLRNQAPFTQEYPSLELTLTDLANQAVARRVFKPANYLSAKVLVADGMAARSELAVNLPLDTGQVAASGYRLYLFYP